jgi:alpha-ketoglutarate-dependent 2,4-dichlorophenoxyacetate dioxygenase
MALHLSPLHPLFAAEVRGIDLRQTPDAAGCAEIHRAMDRYAVLVFRDQRLDDDQQMGFGAALGPLEQTRGVVDAHKHRLKHHNMADISNIDVDGNLLAADDRRRMFNLGNQLWHSDSSFKATPALYSMLHARLIPPEGGETEFADCRAAYDALPEALRAEAEERFAEHWVHHSRSTLGWEPTEEEIRGSMAAVRWPLVRVHPGSGRKALYIGSHARRVLGMALPAGRILLRDLTEHATQPEFVYRHAWQPGDLVLWDNRSVLHRGCRYDLAQVRDMRRTTVLDPASVQERDCGPDAEAA